MTQSIPRQFMFVYGLRRQRAPFHLCHFLSIESCFQVHRPERILFFYHHEPFGPYWELAKRRVMPVRIAPKHRMSIFRYGLKNRSCWKYRYAHQSDFIRLEKLLEYGGVYADIDTLFVQPFPEGLWRKEFVLGREGDITCADSGAKRPSLCNALLMARKDAAFGRIWLERMGRHFDGTWSRHSTLLPFELSQQHPELVHVEPERSFYKHLWTPEGLRTLLQGYDGEFSGVYSMHLWAHLWWSQKRLDFSPFHAGLLTEKYVRTVDTTYTVVARRFMPQGLGLPRLPARVSVVIPTRDRPALLRQAVESLLRQSRPAAEIIIVDDGSQPENLGRIDEIGGLHPAISIFHLGANRGVSVARNFGLTRASGEFIVFHDDDDLMHSRALELKGDFLAGHPDRDIVVCRSGMLFGTRAEGLPPMDAGRTFCPPAKFWLIDQFDGQRLQENPFREILRFAVPIHSIMFRRSCLDKAPFREDLRMGEEKLLLLNLAQRGYRFMFDPHILSFVRVHPGNAQLGPDGNAESSRFLHLLLSSGLAANGHDRFICHARLLQLGLRLHSRSVWPHVRFLLRFPGLLLFSGSWYLSIQVKKKIRWQKLVAGFSPETGEGSGP